MPGYAFRRSTVLGGRSRGRLQQILIGPGPTMRVLHSRVWSDLQDHSFLNLGERFHHGPTAWSSRIPAFCRDHDLWRGWGGGDLRSREMASLDLGVNISPFNATNRDRYLSRDIRIRSERRWRRHGIGPQYFWLTGWRAPLQRRPWGALESRRRR